MGEFKKRGDFGGRDKRRDFGGSSFGERSRFGRPGNKDFRQAQMFSTTCSECHKPCEVPFRPNGEKPVYCNYCFGKNKAGGQNEFPRRDAPSNNFPKREFVPAGTPVARPAFDGGQINDIKKQLEVLNTKLDRLVEALAKTSAPVSKSAEKPVEKKAEAKVVAPVAKKIVAKAKPVAKKKPVSKKK